MDEDTRAIEGRIEGTRERMGDAVAALSHKTDVRRSIKDSVSEKTSVIGQKIGRAHWLGAIGLVAFGGFARGKWY